ncbi:MAG TPA: oligosaccharide flippase family protein [Ornithinibacter sp.]|nr:oligosaccharide flippase family protein [Ornithinibacter sp.]
MSTSTEWRTGASWSLSGGVLAGALMYAATLVSGRILGPEGFGEVAFAVVLAQLGTIACVRGFDFAAARAIVLSKRRQEVPTLVGTAYAVVSANAIGAGLVLCLIATPLAASVGWARVSIIGAAALLLPASLKALHERVVPALGMTRALATVRPLEGALLLVALLGLFLASGVRPSTVLAAMVVCSLVVLGVLIAVMRRRRVLGRPSRRAHRDIGKYAGVVLALTLAPLPLQYADRIVVQQSLSDTDLGLYVACATATQVVASQVVSLLSGVLLPGVLQDGPSAIAKLRRWAAVALLPGVALFGVALTASLWLFGSAFQPSRALVALFACLGAVQLVNGLLHVIVIAEPRSARLDVRMTLARSAVFVTALLVLVQRDALTLESVVATLLIVELIHTVLLAWLTSRTARLWAGEGMDTHAER